VTPAERATWLEERRKGLGGSDVAAVLGLSPWATPFDVWVDKVDPLPDEDSSVKRRGRLLERAVGEWAAEELERILEPAAHLVHPVHTWARGTPDFWLTDPNAYPFAQARDRLGLECKTARYMDGWGEPGAVLEVPPHYRVQALWYLAISEAPAWVVAVFGTTEERWELLELDRATEAPLLERLLEVAGSWWERHVVGGDPPELDLSRGASRWLQRRHPTGGELRDAVGGELELLERYREAKELERVAVAERKALEVRLKAAIGDAGGLRSELGSVRWSRYDARRLEGKRLRKERPDLVEVLDAYSPPKPTGRLTARWKENP